MNTGQQARAREHIFSSVTRDAATDCWIWARQISNSGYGRITLGGKGGTFTESAHRASYFAFIGAIPADGIIRQTCGDRLCVNPDHLELEVKTA